LLRVELGQRLERRDAGVVNAPECGRRELGEAHDAQEGRILLADPVVALTVGGRISRSLNHPQFSAAGGV
jgi:hypothetical protein